MESFDQIACLILLRWTGAPKILTDLQCVSPCSHITQRVCFSSLAFPSLHDSADLSIFETVVLAARQRLLLHHQTFCHPGGTFCRLERTIKISSSHVCWSLPGWTIAGHPQGSIPRCLPEATTCPWSLRDPTRTVFHRHPLRTAALEHLR